MHVENNSSSIIQSFTELYDVDSLKMLLKSIPTSRTNFYFETKTLIGFKENLKEEIHDLLIELQATEDNLNQILKIFNLFIDKQEKQNLEKDENLFNLTNENEKLIMKLSFGHNTDNSLIVENMNLFEKNSALTEEIEILDQECQRYEKIIQDLRAKPKNSPNRSKRISDYDLNQLFLKNAEKLKESFPEHFCKCLGNYQEIKSHNISLREKIADLNNENEDLQQNLSFWKQKLEKHENNEKQILFENTKLKAQLHHIKNSRSQFLSEIGEISKEKAAINKPKIKSLSPIRSDTQEIIDLGANIQNKYCRSPILRKNKQTEIEIKNISQLRETVRRKTKVLTVKYSSLMAEIQRSLEEDEEHSGSGSFKQIFDVFDGRLQENLYDADSQKQEQSNPNIFENGLQRQSKLTRFHENSNLKDSGSQRKINSRFVDNIYEGNSYINRSLKQFNLGDEKEIRTKKKNEEESSFKNLKKNKLTKRNTTTITEKIRSKNKRETIDTTSFEKVIKFIEQKRDQGNQGNCEIVKPEMSPREQGLTGDNLMKKNVFYTKKQLRGTGRVNFTNVILFMQLFCMNLIINFGFWIIDKKTGKKGFFGRIIEKLKDFNLELLKQLMLLLGFWIVFQINFFFKVSNKIRGTFAYFTRKNSILKVQ